MKSLIRVLLWAALPALTSLPAAGQSASLAPIALDRSFHAMYNLDFPLALREAAAFGKEHPEDARAQIAEASAHLFAELERLHVLQSEFFASDTGFDARNKLKPDADEKAAFDMAVDTAERKAQAALAREPKYPDALFSLALANGLRADYAALIEKRDFAALGFTKKATAYAEQLLALKPDYYDAYLSTGLGKYLIGSKPAPVRWVLRLGGFKGNKEEGMKELTITAEHGRLLAPFARLLLAVGYLREQRNDDARKLLLALRDEFPGNPLYAQEAAKIR